MDDIKLNEYVEETIKDAEKVIQFNSKKMHRLLPLLVEYYRENDSHKKIIENILDGDKNSFDELARKFNASPDEQTAFEKYVKYTIARGLQQAKESAALLEERTPKGNGFDRTHPHIWFSINLKKINTMLRYFSIYKMQNGYFDELYMNGPTLTLKTGELQIQKRGNDFELLVPVIRGCFTKGGTKHEFKYKCIKAIYKQNGFYHDASISQKGIKAGFHELEKGNLCAESDINITDSDFLELLNRLPEVIGCTDIQMDIKDINLTVRTILKWDGSDAICFQLYVNTSNSSDISYTTQTHCQPDMIYIRNAPLLYKYMREGIIKKLKEYGFNEHDRIVIDDVRGVVNTDHIHLCIDERSVNFFEFQLRLNPDQHAIEMWIKGEVKVCGSYNNFELNTRVFYDISYDKNKFRTLFQMKKNQDYWAWAKARFDKVKDPVLDSGKKQCQEIETMLNSIAFEWLYPFFFDIKNINIYDKNGYVSLEYSLNI